MKFKIFFLVLALFSTSAMAADSASDKAQNSTQTSSAVSDKTIRSAIADKLKQDPDLSKVHFVVHHGKVTLMGTVKTKQQSDNAESDAKGVSGVQKVKNKIKVKPGHKAK